MCPAATTLSKPHRGARFAKPTRAATQRVERSSSSAARPTWTGSRACSRHAVPRQRETAFAFCSPAVLRCVAGPRPQGVQRQCERDRPQEPSSGQRGASIPSFRRRTHLTACHCDDACKLGPCPVQVHNWCRGDPLKLWSIKGTPRLQRRPDPSGQTRGAHPAAPAHQELGKASARTTHAPLCGSQAAAFRSRTSGGNAVKSVSMPREWNAEKLYSTPTGRAAPDE